MMSTSIKPKYIKHAAAAGPVVHDRRKARLEVGSQSLTLGELITAMYDAARTETDNEEEAVYLAALSTVDILLKSRNGRALLRLLNP